MRRLRVVALGTILACSCTASSGSACATLAACCPNGTTDVGLGRGAPEYAACTTPTSTGDEAQCASALAMLHELGSCLPDAGTSTTEVCASAAQSVTFNASGNCTPNGTLTLTVASAGSCGVMSTQSGSLDFPSSGTFDATASLTGYDLAKGSWTLSTPGNTREVCSAAVGTGTTIEVSCITDVCVPGGDDGGLTCTSSDGCTMTLSRAAPDGG